MNKKVVKILEEEQLKKTGTLILNNCELTRIPADLLAMPWIKILYINYNQIEKIENLETLVNLKQLNLSANKIKKIEDLESLVSLKDLDLSSNQIEKIENLEALISLRILYLYDNNITKIENLDSLISLEELSLSSNQIKKIENFNNLNFLDRLYLGNNQIEKIENLENLIHLKELVLYKNQISQTDGLESLHYLKKLDLGHNPIKQAKLPPKLYNSLIYFDISETMIFDIHYLLPLIEKGLSVILEENKETGENAINMYNCPLPEELLNIIDQGNYAIINYYKDLEEGEETIYEARVLILGEAGVGKTSLTRKLKDPDASMPKEVDDTTVGIDIIEHIFPERSKDQPAFKMNIWDFGGQQIYHSTHQFFMSHRSLYILLGNGRREDNPELYWLPIQQMLGGKSPVLLVLNKRGDIQHTIPMNQLRQRFPNLREDLITLNLSSDRNAILRLTQAVEHQLRGLPQFLQGEKLPKKWAAIRAKLLSLEAYYIPVQQFRNICSEEGITEIEKQDFVSNYLHDLGVILHFTDNPLLKKMVILKPTWATDAVYRILDHTKEKNSNGRFTRTDLNKVWNCSEYSNVFDELLMLMEKFELCYKLPVQPEQYLVPKLVTVDKPGNFTWDALNCLQVRYEYDVMPKGILQRLIVRKHGLLSKNTDIWQYGALFEYNNAKALVLQEGPNKLSISATGYKPGSLIDILSAEIDDVNSGFTFTDQLNVKKLVPCICRKCRNNEKPYYYNYTDLQRRDMAKIETIECNESFEKISIKNLLETVFNRSSSIKGTVKKKIFISYSKDDIADAEKLKDHLSFLKNKLEVWYDQNILAGTDWNNKIKTQLQEADIIIFLVSASLYSADYVIQTELPIALERLSNKDGLHVVPIIIKDCLWEKSEFGKLNAPSKGRAINTWDNKDTGWKEVAKAIDEIISSGES